MSQKSIYTSLLLLTLVTVFSFYSCKEEPIEKIEEDTTLQVERKYRPLFHHFSSTDCGPCGRLGIPTLKQIQADMGDTVLTLITHFKYRDPFITESSQAIEQAFLLQWYSPQLWVNNENISTATIYNGIDNAVKISKEKLREELDNEVKAYVGMRYTEKENMRFDAEIVVENQLEDSATFFVEIYTMEDSLIAAQAGNEPYTATHFGVNRGGYYGQMGEEIKLGGKEQFRDAMEIIPCWGCTNRNLFFYMIVWEKFDNGKYGYVNGREIRN